MRHISSLSLALLLVLTLGSSPVSGSSRAAVCGKLVPPADGMYFGAFPDFYFWPPEGMGYDQDYVRARKVDEFEETAGRKIVWANFAQHWFKGLGFPRENVLTLWRNGQVPLVRLIPASGYQFAPPFWHLPEERFSLQHIIEGQFDEQLRAWADAARDSEIPILAQLGAELNADHFPWSMKWNGAGNTGGYGDPNYPDGAERYRDAYRHIVILFREEGASNVTWFFHVDSYRQYDWWNELKWYYPGDDYIDWLGISNYGSNRVGLPIEDFADKLDASRVYADLTQMSSRPIAVLETGVVEGPSQAKPNWITRTFAVLRSGRYPRISGVAWWSGGTDDIDLHIDTSPEALVAFRNAVGDPYFGKQPHFTGDCIPAAPTKLAVRPIRGGFRLTWTGYPNATRYEIRKNAKRVAVTEAARFDDRAVRKGHRYKYVVRALNSLGPGPFSKPISARR